MERVMKLTCHQFQVVQVVQVFQVFEIKKYESVTDTPSHNMTNMSKQNPKPTMGEVGTQRSDN